jgi:hypothetical protein
MAGVGERQTWACGTHAGPMKQAPMLWHGQNARHVRPHAPMDTQSAIKATKPSKIQ